MNRLPLEFAYWDAWLLVWRKYATGKTTVWSSPWLYMFLEKRLCFYPNSTLHGTLLSNSTLVKEKLRPNVDLPLPISKLGPGTVRGADKSLAPPGRKHATATKLRIYSTYSPRSSVHFLVRCSSFCKPLKKIQKVVRPTRSPRQQWPPRRTKNGDLSIVLSVQGTGGSPTGPDSENRVGYQDTGSPGRLISSGLQVLGEPEPCRSRTRRHWWPSRGVFNCTSRDE